MSESEPQRLRRENVLQYKRIATLEAALAQRDRMLDDIAYKFARELHNSGEPASDYEPSQELVSAVLAALLNTHAEEAKP